MVHCATHSSETPSTWEFVRISSTRSTFLCLCNIRHYWQHSARSGKQAIGGLAGESGLTATLEPSVIGQGGRVRHVHVCIETPGRTKPLSLVILLLYF